MKNTTKYAIIDNEVKEVTFIEKREYKECVVGYSAIYNNTVFKNLCSYKTLEDLKVETLIDDSDLFDTPKEAEFELRIREMNKKIQELQENIQKLQENKRNKFRLF